MKVYLDTNIVFGFFKNFLEHKYMFKPLNIPKKLRIIARLKEVYISDLVVAEVIKGIKLWCRDNNIRINREEIEKMIDDFKRRFKIKTLKSFKLKNLADFALYGIDLNDGIHLEISKNKNMIFVTDDKKLYEASRYFYEKVLSFTDLEYLLRVGQRRIELRSQPCKGCVLPDRLLAHLKFD